MKKIIQKGRRKKIIIIRTIAFFLLVGILFECFDKTLRVANPYTIACVQGFYKEPENSLDVVMIGASEIFSGYCPTRAWEQYGYTSYSLAVSGAPGSVYKSLVRETLSKQNPKLVVIEINGFINNDAYYERPYFLHSYIDYIPDKDRRQLTIEEAIPESDRDAYGKSFGCNHNNWKNLKGCYRTLKTEMRLAREDVSYLKGYASKPTGSRRHAKKRHYYFTAKSRAYLTDLLEYCKEQGLEHVLFTRFPHANRYENTYALNQIEDLIRSYGYDFVNFDKYKKKIQVRKGENYYNPEHMNITGGQKFTDYIGKYIIKHYDVKQEHPAEVKENWDMCAQKASEWIEEWKARSDDSGVEFLFEGEVN